MKKICLFLLTAALSAASAGAADGPLVNVATYMLPGPRYGVAAVADSDAIYVIGGREGGTQRHFLGQIVRFDLRSHESAILTSSVFPRGFFGAVLAGGKIYIMGGDAWGSTLHTMQIYDIATNQISDGPRLPQARSNFGAALVGGRIYLAGGFVVRPNTTDKVDIFDLGSRTWAKGPPMPYPVGGQAALVGDNLVFAGGGIGERHVRGERGDSARVQVLNTRNGTWGFLPPLAAGMSASGITALDGRLYLFGDPYEITQGVAYDLSTGRSRTFDLGNKGYRSSTAITVGNLIYVIGGNLFLGRGLASAEINVFALNPNWKMDAPE